MDFSLSDFERDYAPILRAHAINVFGRRPDREELVDDTISEGWCILKAAPPDVKAGAIAKFAVRRVAIGRQFRMSTRCLLGPNPRRKAKAVRQEFTVKQLGRDHDDPAELAALRIDYPAWVQTLAKRERKVLVALLRGDTTGEIANRLQYSSGRISQLRRYLMENWLERHS